MNHSAVSPTQGLRGNLRKYTMFIALAAIWIIFSLATEGIFIEPRNLSNLFLQTVVTAIVASGMTLIIVTGNIDLSVGSVAGFAGAVAAVLQVRYGMPTAGAWLAALATGLMIGAWHGFWVACKGVPSFIVTLASMMVFRGAILGVTGGATVSPLSEGFKAVGVNYLSPTASAVLAGALIVLFLVMSLRLRAFKAKKGLSVASPGTAALKIGSIVAAMAAFFGILICNQGIPYAVLVLMALVFALGFLARNTVFGRRLYAIGGNSEAAKLSGINIRANLMALFMLFGALVALAGLVMTARINAATVSAGVNMELDAIAACVIGGTSLMGGAGTIIGSVIGALIMASLDNGMSLMNVDITYQYIIKGLILLIAVWIDIATRKQ